ncbi:methyl-CpG-binding domain protein 1a isoform X1 [Siphateles boraxobius]|uniref:methyl-CpG-binding domain protein 1a isoform X1 n=1 Tax=Siphateles boraxobius TaxID=180520 RepID=UPI00406480B3
MTDELNRASAEPETMNPEETVPALLSENHPIGADDVTAVEENTEWDNMPGIVTVELPPDWLKPMEEDEDGVERVRSVPKVKRRRGRPPSARNVRQGLTRLDFKKGLHMDRTKRTKSARSQPEINNRSSLSSGTARPLPDPTRTPEVLPRTIQSIIHSSTSTPQRPRLTPCSPAGVSSLSNTPNAEFNSPPRLTRVSPLNIDTSRTRDFIHSPSVKVGNVSQQIVSSSSEPGTDGAELPLRLWLYPSLEPISPTKTQDELISDQTVISPDFPETRLNGTMALKESHPMLSKCENCGCPFSAQKPGDTLCFRCRPKSEKYSPPNIVFRKVGQDQWEVGKTKHPRKQILKPRPKFKKIEKKDFAPDGGDEDDWAQKKRNRRMCQQCVACLREDDCGKCDFCMDKPKYGGSNKKRQKCRLRQCKFESKLHGHSANRKLNPSLPRRRNVKPKLKRRGRPAKKRKFRSKPWEDDDDDDDDDDDEDEMSDKDNDEEEVRQYKMNGSKARGRKKWNYSFKEEDDDMFIEAVIEDDEPSNIEEDPDILGNERSMMESNVMYSNSSGLGAQGLYYNMPGMPVAPHMLGSVPMCNNNQMPLGEVIGSLPMGDDATQNGFLQIEMVRVGSPPSHFTEEPQNTQQHVSEHQQEATPVITQIFSLAAAESDCDRDQGLMELFTSLGQTVLPAHWVCVMAKGPVLQLLQCSKLSTMADTIVQIEKGFFYQVSVQNQPLLLMHAIYSRHPTCLETLDHVVSLLLDLEGLGVCQGYQSLDMGSPWEPRMCVRAALCDLLISKDEEHCVKCTQPVEG